MDDPVLAVDAAMARIRASIGQRRLSKLLARSLPEVDLGVMGVVDAIDQQPGAAGVGEVAAALAVDPSVASRRVASAVAAGLVERVADPDDGRRTVLVVAPAGRRWSDQVAGHRRAWFAAALAGLSPGDRARFAELLTAFVDGLDTAFDQG